MMSIHKEMLLKARPAVQHVAGSQLLHEHEIESSPPRTLPSPPPRQGKCGITFSCLASLCFGRFLRKNAHALYNVMTLYVSID